MPRGFLYLIFAAVVSFAPLALYAGGGEESEHEPKEFDAGDEILSHISDANEIHIWKGVHLPLPVILYAPEDGWSFFMSSKFDHGHQAVDGYVLNHSRVNRVADATFPKGIVHIGHFEKHEVVGEDGTVTEQSFVTYDGKLYALEKPSKFDGGLFGGGITSFYDFSITKNVFTLLLGVLILILIFRAVAARYRKHPGKAPSGIQGFIEPIFLFIRDEVTRPMIGEKQYERFQPFIMAIFFFILIVNLLGLVPFFPGGANVAGNIGFTMTLALFTLIITSINGNAHYWKHIFWMPGVPVGVKPILTVVEILGVFIKPFSLMIRLFANISAGHIMILSLIGLIFILGDSGQSLAGAGAGGFIGMLLTIFMNLIELLVAFLQAFIFAILAASYFGAAVEESHDH